MTEVKKATDRRKLVVVSIVMVLVDTVAESNFSRLSPGSLKVFMSKPALYSSGVGLVKPFTTNTIELVELKSICTRTVTVEALSSQGEVLPLIEHLRRDLSICTSAGMVTSIV